MLKAEDMAARHIFAVINPVAGGGRGYRAWARIRPVLRATGADLAEMLVDGPGRAEEVAARAATQGYEVIVSVGGDGTVYETLNGMLRARPHHPPALAIIPGGTSNVFARGLDIPRDPGAAAGLLFHGVRRRVDVGQVNDRYFAAVAGVGFDAAVAWRARRWPRWMDGTARHVGAGLATLARYRATEARITVDGETVDVPLYFLTAANTPWYGASIRIAPHARPDDGQLAVVYATGLRPFETIALLFKAIAGTHLRDAKVGHATAREVRVESAVPLPVQADGDPVGYTPVTFRCRPGALEVLVPRPAPE